MMRAFFFLLAMTTAAMAHGLNVFAFVEGDQLVVEPKFSSGRVPVAGEVRVLDGNEALLLTHTIEDDSEIRLPLEGLDTSTGLVIEVDTDEGHSDYWVLTPEDITAGQ